jgi:hypothetical protein
MMKNAKILLVLSIVCLTAFAGSDALAQRRGGAPTRAATWQRPPIEIGATYGNMWGGNLQLVNGRLRTATGPSLGIFLDIPLHAQATLELSYTRQDGALDWDSRTGKVKLTDLSMNFWQIGVVRNLMPGRVVPFVTTSIGANYMSPTEATVVIDGTTVQTDAVTKLAFTIGVGAKAFFGENERFGLRASFKVLPTMYNTGGGIFIGTGGASVGLTGNAIWQWEVAGGLVVKLGG